MNNALKAISRTNDTLRVGNYIVLFGGRDLEGVLSDRKNADGSTGEYFAPDTQLESDYTKAGILYVDWEHGMDSSPDAPKAGDLLGVVDWSTAKADERGVWVERALNRRSQYVRALEALIDAGLVGNSSEAVPDGVQKADDGKITRWPLKRDTLTVTPMEPRMLTENVVSALKALNITVTQPEPEAEPEADNTAAAAAKAANQPIDEQQEDTMSEEKKEAPAVDVEALVAQAAAKAIEAYKAGLAKEPPTNSGLVVTKDETDHKAENPELAPYATLGEQLVDVVKAAKGARRGAPPPIRLLKAHKDAAKAISGASEMVPADAGFLVQTDQAGMLVKPDLGLAPILGRARRIPISGNADSVKLYGIDESNRATGSRYGGIRAYRLSEGDSITASKPKFREIRLAVNKVGVAAYSTDEALSDAALLEATISGAARDELVFFAEDDIINGTGSGMPSGVLSSANAALVSVGKETGQAADTIVAQNIINMWSHRWLRGKYVWLIGQNVEPQLMQLSLGVGTGGALVYMPPGGLSQAPYGSLFGVPVIPTEYNAALGDKGDIALVDLSQYLFADKAGPQSASSIHVEFLTDQTVFRFLWRYDGQPAWHAYITPYKATSHYISPYVTLDERA